MKRRNFVQLCVAGAGVGVVAPTRVFAGNERDSKAGGVYYTKAAPGRWSKKVGGHLPSVELNKTNGKIIVRVITAHEMNGYEHYIVKHVLLDKDYNFIDEYMFNPLQESSPISTFTLEGYTGGTLYALSMCNKHDLWLNEATV
jgi:superoxide reductase